jgi:hypothetical protein
MPLHDDETVLATACLYRVLRQDPNWTKTESDGRRRPTSLAFFSSDQEVSYYVNAPGVLDELQRKFRGHDIAEIPVSVVRGAGFVIERRPTEVDADFQSDPNSHVVAGPSTELTRDQHQRVARAIAKHPNVHMIPPAPAILSEPTNSTASDA